MHLKGLAFGILNEGDLVKRQVKRLKGFLLLVFPIVKETIGAILERVLRDCMLTSFIKGV